MPRYHQHHHHQVRPAPPPSMRSAPSVAAAVAHTETTKEIAQTNTTSDPKIRRNALHAYISYMIYTDLISHVGYISMNQLRNGLLIVHEISINEEALH